MQLDCQRVMTLLVKVEKPLTVGETGEGRLVIIPITGGSFEGETPDGGRFSGIVCPGGADWNTALSETAAHVLARYWLETEDGEHIAVYNEGYVDFSREDSAIKTTPRFECDKHGKYAFLTSGVYVGELCGAGEDAVRITVYRVERPC